MGMGLVMLTEPALLVDVSDSVEFCAEHNLEPVNQNSGAVRFSLAAWTTGALVVLLSMFS